MTNRKNYQVPLVTR